MAGSISSIGILKESLQWGLDFYERRLLKQAPARNIACIEYYESIYMFDWLLKALFSEMDIQFLAVHVFFFSSRWPAIIVRNQMLSLLCAAQRLILQRLLADIILFFNFIFAKVPVPVLYTLEIRQISFLFKSNDIISTVHRESPL